MNLYNLINFCMYFFVGIIFIVIGIYTYKMKKPCGFWSGETPPKNEDVYNVKEYNNKHGIMWIIYGVSVFIASVPMYFKTNGDVVIYVVVVVGGIVPMIIYHNYLYKKYVHKNKNN